MLHSMRSFRGGSGKSFSSRRRARMPAALARALEGLEQRLLLSVSAQVLAGPLSTPGNTWTYEIDSNGEIQGTETITSMGATTFNGKPAIELDISTTGGTSKNYYAFVSQGLVLYDISITGAGGGTHDDRFSPFEFELPAIANANVSVTGPKAVETITTTPSGGSPTVSTESISNTTTLITATPSVPTLVNAGTFNCFQIHGTKTTTTDSDTTTSTTDTFVDPSVGIVKIVDDDTGNITQLTHFSGTSFHLELSGQPGNVLVGEVLNAHLQVALKDPSNAVDTKTADAVTITASIDAASTGPGTLKGTTSVTTSKGIAKFGNLTIDQPGDYIVDFTDNYGRMVSTEQFHVSLGKLVIKRISNGLAGRALNPAVEVDLVDSKNKLITNAPSLVTLSIAGGNSGNPVTGVTATLVGGVALFPNVKIGIPDSYIFSATDAQNDVGGLSNSFDISGLHFVIHAQPGTAGINERLRYTVLLEDSRGSIINSNDLGLRLTLNTISGGADAAIDHNSDIFNFGVANNSVGPFATINSPGTYTITFSVIVESGPPLDYAIPAVTTDSFKVVANHLVFTKQPSSKGAGVPLVYQVEIKDFQNHLVTTSTDHLTFTLLPTTAASTGVLSSNLDALSAGIATNSLGMMSIDVGGSYKLSVVDVPGGPTDPLALPATSGVFKVKASK